MVRLATVRGLITLPAEELPSPDARLHLTIDRVGVHTGAAREVWLRVAARLEPAAAGAPAGPFYAIGTAASPKWLIKPGYVWTDSDLLAEAARQASRQIVHTLRTGDEALFVRASRAAVIPAMIPAAARKINEIEGAESFVSAADVQRQADVLFQPGLTPVVDVVARDEVLGAMKKLGLKPERIWSADGSPAVESACAVGRHLDADFVFVSRISDISLTRRTASILQMGVTRIGEELNAEVEVTGAFIRTADSRVLWQDSVTGSSAARTQFTKRGPRIRKEDQCLSDAARVGYSWLRSSFENHKRQFEK